MSENFYGALAPFYDQMTRFNSRRAKLAEQLKAWVKELNIKSALDAACGSGVAALALSDIGVKSITGVDLSEELLAQAKKNDKEGQVNWICNSLENLDQLTINTPFDALFCIGNSLPHLHDKDSLLKSFKAFKQVLAPAGSVFIELINYDLLYQKGQREVGLHRTSLDSNSENYLRFYDFEDQDFISFNVLNLKFEPEALQGSIQSWNHTRLRAWRANELLDLLKEAGFTNSRCLWGLAFPPQEFISEQSPNLLLWARVS